MTRRAAWISRAAAFAVALSVVAACNDDTTGVQQEPLTAENAAQTMNDVVSTFFDNNDALNSLDYFGDYIGTALGGGPVAPVETSAPTLGVWQRHLLNNFATLSRVPANLPSEILGVTFVWDEQQTQYVASQREGAPTNGIRFVIYAVNPITGLPASPLNEIGYLDIIDTSTTSTASVSLVAVVDGMTLISADADYTYDEVSGTESLSLEGFFSDGESQLNYDFLATAGSTQYTFGFEISVGGFSVTQSWTATEAGITFSTTLTDGENDIVFSFGLEPQLDSLVVTDGSGISYNDQVIAVISGSATETEDGFDFSITISNAEGEQLSAAELQSLGTVFDIMAELDDFFNGMLNFALGLIFLGMI